jgi:hypothetical protein
VKEFRHSFTDSHGNTLAYLCVSSPENGELGTVTLHFSENKSQQQRQEAIEECKSLARMLNIEFNVENSNG